MIARGRSIRIAVIHTVIALVIFAIFFGAVLYFGSQKIKSLEQQVSSLKKKEGELLKKRDELPKVAEVFPILLEHASIVSTLFPPSPGDKELVDFLTSRGEATGVKVTVLDLSDPEVLVLTESKVGKSDLLKGLDKTVVDEVSTISFQIRVRGDFKSLLDFLNSLKVSGRFIRVERISGPTAQERGVYAPSFQEWQLSGTMYFTSEKLRVKTKFEELAASISRLTGIKLREEVENPATREGGDNLTANAKPPSALNISKDASTAENPVGTNPFQEKEKGVSNESTE